VKSEPTSTALYGKDFPTSLPRCSNLRAMTQRDAGTVEYSQAMFKSDTPSAYSRTHDHRQGFVVELFTIDHGFELCFRVLTFESFESGAL
jgi:hypothetical protein